MPINLKVFIQTLQKSQDMQKISFAFEFENKNIKKVYGANLPPPPSPDTFKLDLPPDIIRVNGLISSKRPKIIKINPEFNNFKHWKSFCMLLFPCIYWLERN